MNKGSEDGRGIWFGRVKVTGGREVGTGLQTLLGQGTGIEFWGSKEPREVSEICNGEWYGFEWC